MLVLSRKPGEKIHIGPGITITLVQIRGNQVRLGIDAPKQIPVVRAELNEFLAMPRANCSKEIGGLHVTSATTSVV